MHRCRSFRSNETHELDQIYELLKRISRTPHRDNRTKTQLVGAYMYETSGRVVSAAEFLAFLRTLSSPPPSEPHAEDSWTLAVHSLEETQSRAIDGATEWHTDARMFPTGQTSIVWIGCDPPNVAEAGLRVSTDPSREVGSISEDEDDGMQHASSIPSTSRTLEPFKMHSLNLSYPYGTVHAAPSAEVLKTLTKRVFCVVDCLTGYAPGAPRQATPIPPAVTTNLLLPDSLGTRGSR